MIGLPVVHPDPRRLRHLPLAVVCHTVASLGRLVLVSSSRFRRVVRYVALLCVMKRLSFDRAQFYNDLLNTILLLPSGTLVFACSHLAPPLRREPRGVLALLAVAIGRLL